MRGAWCGLSTTIVAAIQTGFEIHISHIIFSLVFFKYF
jgi:hypothetical protein